MAPAGYVLIGIVALFATGRWELPAFMQKKPKTEQLTKAQADAATAKAEADKAKADLAALQAAQEAKKTEQLRYAQSMAEGTGAALKRVPAEHQTAEVGLASDLNARTQVAMSAAIGDLPPDQRAEILKIVDGALSKVESERDQARADLAKKDAALAEATTARGILEKQLPAVQAKLDQKEAGTAPIR